MPLSGLVWPLGCNRKPLVSALVHSMILFVACKSGDLFVLRREKAIDVARREAGDLPCSGENEFEGDVLDITPLKQREANNGVSQKRLSTC